MSPTDEELRVDLVFQGGGVKGVGLVGAYSVLEERGYRHQNLAGSSAGAILAALIGAGYTAAELSTTLSEMPFSRLLDKGWEDRIPVAGIPLSILKDQGIYEGDALLDWMRKLLAEKGKTRFGELVLDEFAEEPRYRHKVQLIASDVTARQLLVLPRDAPRIGVEDPDDLEIALAVRMSSSIPIFFEPVSQPTPDGEHLIADGGMLSNFPVWLFDSEGPPQWPTFGLKLVSPEPRKPVLPAPAAPPRRGPVRRTIGYLTALVSTMTDAHDKLYLEKRDFVRTITVSNLGVRTTEFNLSPERAQALYEEGRRSAERFLESWDFDAYVQAFRAGKETSRRQEIEDDLRAISAEE